MFRTSVPWFFENSKLPALLSKIAPIEIGAITIGPFVYSRGEISEVTRNHETIHWQQYIETGIVGFVILYYLFWFINFIRFGNGKKAYYMIPFEMEAYENDENLDYLSERKRYNWIKNIKEAKMGAGVILMSMHDDVPKILGLVGDEKHRLKHRATYDLPKGSVDAGESLVDTAIRETFEETGVSIHPDEFIAGPYETSFLSTWLARIDSNTPIQIGQNPVTGKFEHDGFDWLTEEEALKQCYPYLRPFVTWAFKYF